MTTLCRGPVNGGLPLTAAVVPKAAKSTAAA